MTHFQQSLVVAVLAITCSFAGAQAPKNVDEMADKVMPSISYVGGKFGHGSGFLVAGKIVATNAHVVRSDLIEDLKVKFLDGPVPQHEELKVRLLFESKSQDLALLLIPSPAKFRNPLKLNPDFDPKGNKDVYAVGNPGQPQGGISKVNAAARGKSDGFIARNNQQFFQLRFPTSANEINVGPGNSGCPVLDTNGDVIGVLNSGIVNTRTRMPSGTAFCIPAEILRKALAGIGDDEAKWEDHIRKATARHAIDIAIASVYLKAKFGMVIYELRLKNSNAGGRMFNDDELAKEAKDVDKTMQEQIDSALKKIGNSKEMSGKLKVEFDALKANTKIVCDIIYKKNATKAELDRVNKTVDQNEKTLDKLLTMCDLSRSDIEELQGALTSKILANRK